MATKNQHKAAEMVDEYGDMIGAFLALLGLAGILGLVTASLAPDYGAEGLGALSGIVFTVTELSFDLTYQFLLVGGGATLIVVSNGAEDLLKEVAQLKVRGTEAGSYALTVGGSLAIEQISQINTYFVGNFGGQVLAFIVFTGAIVVVMRETGSKY